MPGVISVPHGVSANDIYTSMTSGGYNDYLANIVSDNMASALRRAPTVLSDMVRGSFGAMQQMVTDGVGNVLHDYTRLIESKTKQFTTVDTIKPLLTLEQLQQANPMMRPYIMAHPVMHALNQRELVDAYDGECDPVKGEQLEDNIYYQRAMNGIVVDTDDGIEFTNWVSEEMQLRYDQQIDIYDTHRYLDRLLKSVRKDPSSELGEDRGG